MNRSLLLCLLALCLPAFSAEISLGKTVRLNTQGGGLTQFSWKGHSLVPANGKTGTLTEVAFASRGDTAVDGEAFGKLEFQVRPLETQEGEGASLVFLAQGTQAFRWLLLQKTYTLQKDGSLQVEYTLKNLDDKAHSVGLWVRSLLREGEGEAQQPNRYFFARQGALDSFVHPGPGAQGDFFVMNPTSGTAGVCGPQGVGTLVCLPDDEVEAFYSWRSESDSVATLEWFIREAEIEGGAARQFTLFLLPCGDVPARMDAVARRTAFSGESPCLFPRILAGEIPEGSYGLPPESSLPVSEKYMDVSGKRQFFPSVRAVRFPAETDLSQLGVYACANGRECLDRPVAFRRETLPSGEQRVLFLVPGVNPKGFYWTRFQDGYAYDDQGLLLGEEEFHFRFCLDIPQEEPPQLTPRGKWLLEQGPQLLVNGDVELPSWEDPAWPWGFPWSQELRSSRGMFFWEENGSFDGSRCLRLQLPEGSPFWAIWPVHFRPEPGVKYTASCYAMAENPDQDWAVVQVIQLNGEGKHLRERNVHLQHDKVAFPWKKLEQSFFVEEDIKTAALEFSTLRCPTTSLSMDKLSVVPEDFTYVKRERKELLREELMGSRNPHVEIIEHLDDSVETPHETWLADPAQPLTGVLYLPLASTRTVQTPFRRTILEMAQRMPLEYQYIPLFRKVLRFEHGWDVTFGDSLEEYTMECLRQVQEPPRVILVQAIDFQTMAQPAFVEELLRFRQDGANLLFLGCQNVPPSLLGEETPLPSSWTTLPQMRTLPESLRREGLRGYRSPEGRWSVCFQPAEDEWYLLPKFFACVPQEQVNQNVPSLWGRDFPYWEYLHLQTLKLLRGLAEIPLPARLEACREEEVTVAAREPMAARLRVRIQNLHRVTEKEYTQELSLKAGEQPIILSREGLPGGRHVAHLFLEDQEGKGLDCGATAFSLPETHPLTLSFSHEDRIYQPGEEVEISFACSPWPEKGRLTVRITDVEGRLLQEETLVPQEKASLTFLPPRPLSRLYRVDALLQEGEAPRSNAYGEFALRILKDPRRMDALVWLGYYPMLRELKKLGFTHQMVNLQQDMESMGMLHALADVGIQMVATRAGQLDVPHESELRYRGDIPSDPVRNPCYSDPSFLQALHTRIRTRMEQQHYAFYGITLQEIADEAYLGRSVCYSPFCLAGFRQRLQEEYGTLEALNQEWETSFRRWEEVVPCQLEELPTSENLSRWLDHKLFMTALYAKNWVGGTREAIRQAVPGSQAGLSGTQVPGLSYDWAQLMKYIDCLSFYGGIQRKLVHDLAQPGFVAGEWTGYCLAYQVNEFDQKARLWDNLFLGSNFSSIFMGHGMHGDLSPNPNMKLYSQGLKEIRKGADCLVLSAQETFREVGVLYSQSSLYTAMGTLGANVWHNSQTGWAALLSDLKQPFRYVTYEQLEEGVPEGLKLLVLPCTLSLSRRALEHLQRFVEEGGTLLADFAPAVADEHGKFQRRLKAESLFGVDRSQSTRDLVEFSLDSWGSCTLRYGEGALRLQEAQAGETAPDGTPVLLVRTLGQGRVCLLNLLLTGYQEIQLGGVGGELLTTKSGNALFCQKIREWMDGELQKAGVSPRVQATLTENGELYPAHTTLRQDGENLLFGMVKPVTDNGTGKYPMLFQETPEEEVRVELPVEGFLYDVRKGAFLGQGNTFTAKLVPGDALLVSILSRKPEGLSLQAPEDICPGETVELPCRLEGGEGPQVFRLEVVDPQGQPREEYQQVLRGENAQADFSFAFAWNDPKGAWTLTVTNVNTGLQASRELLLE